MSESSNKAFIEAMDAYPEMDDDERMDEYEDDAIYRSSSIDLQDTLGEREFKFVYPILIDDIQAQPFKRRRIFCQKMLKKIEEVYDYTFPENPELDTNPDLSICLEFIKFLEYDNIIFLSFVWQHLNVNLLNLRKKALVLNVLNVAKVISLLDVLNVVKPFMAVINIQIVKTA